MLPKHSPFRFLSFATIAIISVLQTGEASSQIIDRSTIVIPPRAPRTTLAVTAFRRDRDVPVLERNLPEFSAQGLQLGAFDLFPGVMVAPEFISNVYANNQDRESALALIVRPEVLLRNRGGPVDLDLFARGVITRVQGEKTENTEEAILGGRIEVPVASLSSVFAGGSYGRRILPRYASDSPVEAAKPLEYNELTGNLGGQFETGRVRFILRGDLSRLRFDDAPARGGGTIIARDRDRTFALGTVRAEYAIKPNTSAYIAATINRIDYKLPIQSTGLDRDSKGFGIFIGTSFDLTNLIRADARVGYIKQKFDVQGVRDISGLGLLGTISYFPTGLTTVTLRGERAVRDTGVPGTLGNIHTAGEIQIDHELRRYFIVTGNAGYSRDLYRGAERRDRNAFAAISATYLSRDHWNAKVGYQYNRRHCVSCTVTGAEFDDHRLLASLTFQR